MPIALIPILALAQATVPAAQPTPAAEPKLICKRVQQIGSRLPGRKTCQTKEGWAMEAKDGRDALTSANRGR